MYYPSTLGRRAQRYQPIGQKNRAQLKGFRLGRRIRPATRSPLPSRNQPSACFTVPLPALQEQGGPTYETA